jgi:hypothetical protein
VSGQVSPTAHLPSYLSNSRHAKRARTLAEVLPRPEIPLFNENGVMDSLGDDAAYYDDRAQAIL